MVVADSPSGIQSAIADAISSNGGQVSVYIPAGPPITFSSPLDIPVGASVNISSDRSSGLGRRLASQSPHVDASAASTIIFDGGGSSRLFDVRGRLRLSGVTIQNGWAQQGGCVRIFGDPPAALELTDATIKDCTAFAGGDIVGDAQGGAIYSFVGSSVTLSHVMVTGCAATHTNVGKAYGGAMYLTGDATLRNVIVQGSSANSLNTQAGKGGGLFLANGNLVMSEGTSLTGNSASGSGAQYIATGGKATYLLPAPSGTWINGLRCIVYREPCPVDEKGNLKDPNCETTSQACQYESVHNANVSGTQCQPLLPAASQPCDWCA